MGPLTAVVKQRKAGFPNLFGDGWPEGMLKDVRLRKNARSENAQLSEVLVQPVCR